jgi:hypothetical protein
MNADNSFAFFASDTINQTGDSGKVDTSLSSNRSIAVCLTEGTCSKSEINSMKRNIEKQNVLKEILSSEKKYLNDLREIVEGYYDEIKRIVDNNRTLVNEIFANINEIYEFTR